ncbi:hypothetical protein ALC57_09498 [Trachymyrmex cornetzi]|uniref:Uncharacterized protein n=1 Tax=Trachymyrmex cornetzi TaxID=471704 RepID=A0A151J5A2_9HYME|nr:hypothetical protein ALC57_09498 [Trachymyrmex cornetzi]
MEEICGRKPNTKLYFYDGYTYYKDSRNTNILRCNTRRSSLCSGILKVHNNGQIHLVQDHNHIKMPCKAKQVIMRQEMLQLCRNSSLSLKEIFDTVCRK